MYYCFVFVLGLRTTLHPALLCDGDHHLDYLLDTVAVTGQQRQIPASSKLPSLLLGGLVVCLGVLGVPVMIHC